MDGSDEMKILICDDLPEKDDEFEAAKIGRAHV